MPDGLGFAGTRLANDDIPGKLVDILAPALKFLQAALKLLAEFVEGGPLVGIADRPRRTGGLGFDGPLKIAALAPRLDPLVKEIGAKEQDSQQDNGQRQPNAILGNGYSGANRPQAKGAQNPVNHSILFWFVIHTCFVFVIPQATPPEPFTALKPCHPPARAHGLPLLACS